MCLYNLGAKPIGEEKQDSTLGSINFDYSIPSTYILVSTHTLVAYKYNICSRSIIQILTSQNVKLLILGNWLRRVNSTMRYLLPAVLWQLPLLTNSIHIQKAIDPILIPNRLALHYIYLVHGLWGVQPRQVGCSPKHIHIKFQPNWWPTRPFLCALCATNCLAWEIPDVFVGVFMESAFGLGHNIDAAGDVDEEIESKTNLWQQHGKWENIVINIRQRMGIPIELHSRVD